MDGPCSPKCADKITVRLKLNSLADVSAVTDLGQQVINLLRHPELPLHADSGTHLLCRPSWPFSAACGSGFSLQYLSQPA